MGPHKNGDSHDHGNSSNKNGGSGGNRDPPDRGGGRHPRENGNPEEEGIGSPSMLMYYKGLQDHQAS